MANKKKFIGYLKMTEISLPPANGLPIPLNPCFFLPACQFDLGGLLLLDFQQFPEKQNKK